MDKSEFVAEIINEHADVLLITRPRRFGKTLNLSMLRYFFDINEDCYEKVIDFMRGFLSGALKDNPNLFKVVLTGCLRVAKESIFN